MFVYEKSPHTNEKTEVDPLFDSVFFLSHKKSIKVCLNTNALLLNYLNLKKKISQFPRPSRETEKEKKMRIGSV